jgi:hypothetical protein
MRYEQYVASGRSMRWYEWLAGLFLFGLAFGVRAGSAYKCVDATGAVTFQDRSCAAAQAQSEVEIDPAPAHAAPPQYAVETHAQRANYRESRSQPRSERGSAYECRAGDGRVFYRLGACPRSLAAEGGAARSKSRSGNSVSVSGHAIARDEACAQMRRAGSIGRGGHEFDEQVSTYDKNLGRDPCA